LVSKVPVKWHQVHVNLNYRRLFQLIKYLVDTNLLYYYFTSGAHSILEYHFLRFDFIFVTKMCIGELQKNIKNNCHTIYSTDFVDLLINEPVFQFLPTNESQIFETNELIKKYSMKVNENSQSRRDRDLSFTDAELIIYAKLLNLVILTADKYLIECCDKELVPSFNPIEGYDVKTLDIYNPNSGYFKYGKEYKSS
jgi:predicted nucleic acid-binding protein